MDFPHFYKYLEAQAGVSSALDSARAYLAVDITFCTDPDLMLGLDFLNATPEEIAGLKACMQKNRPATIAHAIKAIGLAPEPIEVPMGSGCPAGGLYPRVFLITALRTFGICKDVDSTANDELWEKYLVGEKDETTTTTTPPGDEKDATATTTTLEKHVITTTTTDPWRPMTMAEMVEAGSKFWAAKSLGGPV